MKRSIALLAFVCIVLDYGLASGDFDRSMLMSPEDYQMFRSWADGLPKTYADGLIGLMSR